MKDLNDLYRYGSDPLAAGDAAKPYKANGAAREDAYKLTCMADVVPVPIKWIWQGYLACGKLTLLCGDPEVGKSMIGCSIAARHTKDAHWPRGPQAGIGATIFICSEDGVADTIRPRLEAAGANLFLVHVLDSTIRRDGKLKSFTLQNDLDLLGEAIDKIGNVSIVQIDAITSYMGKIDSHRTTDVRAVLEPIAGFAERHGVAVLGVTHPPKQAQGNAIRSFTGSLAFVAAARIALLAIPDPNTEGRRLLLPVKNNIGPKGLGLGYSISAKEISWGITAPLIVWDEAPVDYTADQALAAQSGAVRDGGSLKEAISFLQELLANGPISAKDGVEAAAANGIRHRTLERARKELGVKAEKAAFESGWIWRLAS